ncbi:unnamed protein product [Paramecium pentaurelia]|uniref:YTH domain-containing protein n=1 Tax=Paramecium pentaurelia TaxID=43138 RepID=A0A8S1T173_9CILI|nr:unnamed protein product [Paramecium pentaurelia]
MVPKLSQLLENNKIHYKTFLQYYMDNQIWSYADKQSNSQENDETSEQKRSLKGYKQYNQNVQNQQAFFNSQEEDLPLRGYKQQQKNYQVSQNSQDQDLPLRRQNQQNKLYYNYQARLNSQEEQLLARRQEQQYQDYQECFIQKDEDLPLKGYKHTQGHLNHQQEDLPLKDYKQYNKKPQSNKTQYNYQEKMPIKQSNSEQIRNQNQQYYYYQDNSGQGCYSDKNQYFRQNPEEQNREQYNHRDNQRSDYYNRQNNQANQQVEKQNSRKQMPQQYNNICYQFQTQFLRANNYYDINELRTNFKSLRQLNKNHQPSQNSHFVLIRPKNGFQNIHKAIKYGIWCSTSSVNQELSSLYYEKDKCVYLIFYPLGQTSQLIGIAQMVSDYDPSQTYKYWDNDGIYKGSFELIWHSIKNVNPQCIQQIYYNVGIGDIKFFNIDQLRDGTQISYYDALQIFEIFNQAPVKPSVFDHFDVLDMQEDQKRSYKLKNQEKEEFQLKQKGLKKKYQY